MLKNATVGIIGSGLAGICCASELGFLGIDCLVFEKGEFGHHGNSRMEKGGITFLDSGCNSRSDDCRELVLADSIQSGEGLSKNDVIRSIVDRSYEALWFLEKHEIKFPFAEIAGGHSVDRVKMCSRSGHGFGEQVISVLEMAVEESESVNILPQTEVIDINISSDGEFIVTTTSSNSTEKFSFEFLVISSGGFSSDVCDSFYGNKDVYIRNFVDLNNLPKSTKPDTNSNILELINRNLGGNLMNMGELQLHPLGILEESSRGKELVPIVSERILGCGGILVDSSGSRFIDEKKCTRSNLSKRIIKQGDLSKDHDNLPFAKLIVDSQTIQSFGIDDFITEYYAYVKEYDDTLSLCTGEFFNIDTFSAHMDLNSNENNQFYVINVTPVLYSTLGGLEINDCSRVIGIDSKVIPKLYACGEATGSTHGRNELFGNGFLDCIVWGRTCAQDIIFEKIYHIMQQSKSGQTLE